MDTNANVSITSIPCVTKCISRNVDDVFALLSNPKAICADAYTAKAVGDCVRLSCTPKQALITQATFAKTCDVPVRDLSGLIVAITIIFGLLAIAFFTIRMITRLPPFSIEVGLDDGFMSLAVLSMIALSVLCFRSTHIGLGTDVWTISFPHIQSILQSFYASEIVYVFATGFTRISIILFYLRIFGAVRFFRYMVFTMLSLTTLSLVILVPIIVFQCRPISYIWKFWSGEGNGTCLDISAVAWAHATINIILDLIVLLSPVPQLLKLQLSKRRRVQVSIMFSVGLFVTIVCVIRLHSLIKFANTENFSYDRTGISYWSIIEVDTGIICGCMPAAQQFFRRFAPNIFGSSGEVSGSTSNGRKPLPSPPQAPRQNQNLLNTTDTDMEAEPMSYAESQEQYKQQQEKKQAQVQVQTEEADKNKSQPKATVGGSREKFVIWEEEGY